MSYDGGKAGAGVFQALINLMPRHELYIEPFLGNGAVMRKKRPAVASIGIESDAAALALWQGHEVPGLQLLQADALGWLNQLASPEATWRSRAGSRTATASDDRRRRQSPLDLALAADPAQTLIYCDPPYIMSTRSCQRRLYEYELTDDDHAELLETLRALPCRVMISGYRSRLYDRMLKSWRISTYLATTRSGRQRCEWVWMNFPASRELHDYRYLGRDFRERERIKRMQKRWSAKLAKMPEVERLALLSALRGLDP